MANHYSVQDASLTAVAEAIREKTGVSGPLTFPQGFAAAVRDLDLGWSSAGLADLSEPNGVIRLNNVSLGTYAFYLRKITGVYITNTGPETCSLGNRAFDSAKSLVWAHARVKGSAGMYTFNGCTALETAVLQATGPVSYVFAGCSALKTADLNGVSSLNVQAFRGCASLNTLVIRKHTVVPISYANATQGTPFEAGGSGGTVYLPKSLYDHLGDGSGQDYLASANWAALNDAGTVTWQTIEGSPFQTHYADGTEVEP